jgi:hypothetical protein
MTQDMGIIHIGSCPLDERSFNISLRLEILYPSNSYTFGLDSMT